MRSVAMGVTLGVVVGLSGCGESTAAPSGTGGPGTAVTATIFGTNYSVGVGELSVLANGTISAMNSISVPGLTASGGPFVVGIAVDPTGEIFVGEQLTYGSSPTAEVLVFAAGAGANASPVRTIVGTNTQLEAPNSLAVDAAGDVFVGQLVGDVLEFAAGASENVAPVRTLKVAGAKNTGIGIAFGMGADASGNLYVANETTANVTDILVFAPSASGDVAPIRTIGGSANVITGSDIALDAAGNIYVTGETITPALPAVLEFAAGANGSAAPIREITGSNTTLTGNLSNPVLDSSGNIYVLVYAAGTANLVKFAPDANGNAVPAAVSTSGTGIKGSQIALY
jgi:hypothetical protein